MTVRNPDLTHIDFAMILYLKYLVFLRGERYEFEISAPDLKSFINIQDNKTLKKSFHSLYNQGFLLNETGDLKPNKPVMLMLNQYKFDIDKRPDGESFTQLPTKVLFGVKDKKLDAKEARILYYIKSYLIDKEFCFTSQLTMGNELGMSEKTVSKHAESLKEKRLIEIEQHKLGHNNYQYENDRLHITKYNNHYSLRLDNILNM